MGTLVSCGWRLRLTVRLTLQRLGRKPERKVGTLVPFGGRAWRHLTGRGGPPGDQGASPYPHQPPALPFAALSCAEDHCRPVAV